MIFYVFFGFPRLFIGPKSILGYLGYLGYFGLFWAILGYFGLIIMMP
jgi:hypothetical protein